MFHRAPRFVEAFSRDCDCILAEKVATIALPPERQHGEIGIEGAPLLSSHCPGGEGKLITVGRSTNLPHCRLTSNSFTGGSCRAVGLIHEMEGLNLTRLNGG